MDRVRDSGGGWDAANEFTVGEAATVLGVSDDTVRRWADAGRLELIRSATGRLVVTGEQLATLARSRAAGRGDDGRPGSGSAPVSSARNQLPGIVTAVVRDTVMAQVELQCGPFRVVSLMSREAADDLDLQVGRRAVASIKATTVVVGRVDP